MKKFIAMSLLASTALLPACAGDDHRHYHDQDNRAYYDERDDVPPPPPPYKHNLDAKADYFFDQMDLNGDGRISEEEHEAFAQSSFEASDYNEDGYLSRKEVREYCREQMEKLPAPVPPPKVSGERSKKGTSNVRLPNRTNVNPTDHSANPTNPSQENR